MVTPQSAPSLKISCKSVQSFSRNLADKEKKKEKKKERKKETYKQRNRSKTIPYPRCIKTTQVYNPQVLIFMLHWSLNIIGNTLQKYTLKLATTQCTTVQLN